MLQTMRRQTISNETLEPTQFAGFNQFWDDAIGSVSLQQGIGLDHRLGTRTYAGGDVITRRVEVPLFQLPGVSFATFRENVARAYLYHAIPPVRSAGAFQRWSFALSADYFYEEFEHPEDVAPDGVVSLRTHTLPLAVTAFPNSTLSFRFGATYVNRSGLLQVLPGFDRFDADEDGWFGDFVVTYKLPKRRGRISVGVSNALDQRIRIINSNDAALLVAPEQVVFARASLSFQ
jgi:hypothetical protein